MKALTQKILKNLAVVLFGIFTGSGCIYLGVGAIGAVGGYMVSPDTVEGQFIGTYEKIWDAARLQYAKAVEIIEEDKDAGYLYGDAAGTEVVVQISQNGIKEHLTAITEEEVWIVSVRARKNMFPKVRLAQSIYSDISAALIK